MWYRLELENVLFFEGDITWWSGLIRLSTVLYLQKYVKNLTILEKKNGRPFEDFDGKNIMTYTMTMYKQGD